MSERFIVIRDNREKQGKGWKFSSSKYCGGTQPGTLKTGDYSMLGYENILTIERKGSVIEFANNLIQERFYRELDRMEEIRYTFIILEFALKDLISYPYCDGVPFSVRKKIKVSGATLLRKLTEIQLKYKVKVIFAGNSVLAKEAALSIFKRVVENK